MIDAKVRFSSKSIEWATPQDFFDALNEEFQFTLDACADHDNAKCDRYFTIKDNGLAQRFAGERVWCNPPYGRYIGKWIQKCATEPSEVTVMLIPARTDTKIWHEYIFGHAEIRFVKGRLKFGGHKWNAPFPCAVVIFRHGERERANDCGNVCGYTEPYGFVPEADCPVHDP
jgi:phage N-6-adenine-methyltransferase